VGFLLGPWAAVLPALFVTTIAMFLLARRTGKQIELAMSPLVDLLQGGRVDEARALLRGVGDGYGRWQMLLKGSIEAQLGILDYMQLRFDDAMPRLQKGRFRNWMAITCIGCIHYRRGDRSEAFAEFKKAAKAGPKEAIVYAVWATLAVRASDREEALSALNQGVEAMPDSDFLKRLRKAVANKKKINTRKFPDTWYQFFPEDLAKQQVMRGRRDGGSPIQQVQMGRTGAKAIYRAR